MDKEERYLIRQGAISNEARNMMENAVHRRNVAIIELYATGKYSQKELAELAGISTSAVADILRHRKNTP